MKIVYLHQYFNTPAMPGSTRSYEMAKRLVEWGHEVHIVTSYREPCKKKGWFVSLEEGIHVHWLSITYSNKLNYFQRIRAFIHFAYRASVKTTRLSADLIFATSTPLTIAIPGILGSKIKNIPPGRRRRGSPGLPPPSAGNGYRRRRR